ncbi:Hypothetical_protein [Hexamita inflata]|uniref:Hypothetical_protein n=1 Tax=Hexamita inflata TaxID=28002 RepID=A0ABP1I0L2_9EUKA
MYAYIPQVYLATKTIIIMGTSIQGRCAAALCKPIHVSSINTNDIFKNDLNGICIYAMSLCWSESKIVFRTTIWTSSHLWILINCEYCCWQPWFVSCISIKILNPHLKQIIFVFHTKVLLGQKQFVQMHGFEARLVQHLHLKYVNRCILRLNNFMRDLYILNRKLCWKFLEVNRGKLNIFQQFNNMFKKQTV